MAGMTVPPAPAPAVQDSAVAARVEGGATWGDINNHVTQATGAAVAAGHHEDTVAAYKGDAPAQKVVDSVADVHASTKWLTPDRAGDPEGNMRAEYAHALLDGSTQHPAQFAQQVDQGKAQAEQHALGPYHVDVKFPNSPTMDQTKNYPTQEDITDTAISAVHKNGLPLTPENINTAKQNLAYGWAKTGTPPMEIAKQAPDYVTTQPKAPVDDTVLGIFSSLESGGRNVPPRQIMGNGHQENVTGPWQVTDDTARTYGADPAKLVDPSYNKQVAGTILTDLSHRYNGDLAAMAVAYNAGPGKADEWLRGGRDSSLLSDETKKYLQHLSNIVPNAGDLMVAKRDAVFDPMTSNGVTDDEANLKAGWEALKGLPTDLAQARQSAIEEANINENENAGESAKEIIAEQKSPEDLDKSISIALGFSGAGPGAIAGKVLGQLVPHYALNVVAADLAKPLVTEAIGLTKQTAAIASAALEQYRPLVNAHLKEYEEYLGTMAGKNNHSVGPLPVLQHLTNYIEGIPGAQISGEMKDLADAIRGIYQGTRTHIEQTLPNMTGFIQDYYRHMWTDPGKATMAWASRTGSSASLKLRTIPTLMEGIQAGLTPKIMDPIENTLQYVHSMNSYLGNYVVREAGRGMGLVKHSFTGPPVAGWTKLKGASSLTPGGQAYAPMGWARIYNSWVGRGVYDLSNPIWGKIYDKALVAANAMTGLKLGLSGFHAWNIAEETVTSGLAKAIGDIKGGDLARGLAELGLTTAVPAKVGYNIGKGLRLKDAYLNKPGASTADIALMRIAAKVGVSPVGRGQAYTMPGINNYVQAWKRGNLWSQLKGEAKAVAGPAGEHPIKTTLFAPGRATEFFAKQTGHLMSTVLSPLFDHAIPALKTAAWSDEMEQWVRQNPTAQPWEMEDYGRKIANSIDDRFGEMNQDNLFWSRGWKQAMNLLTVSVGWEYGTLRAFGTGASDILNGDVLSPRARWLIALPIINATQANVYQYLRTGQTGFTDWQTMAGAPLTGGEDPNGDPERAWLPGPQKEPYQWATQWKTAPDGPSAPPIAMGRYLLSKANPLVQTAEGVLTGTNYAGKDIRGVYPNGDLPGYWSSYLKFLADQLTSIQMENTAKEGSGIDTAQRIMGIHAANRMMTNPEEFQRTMDYVESQRLREAQHFAGQQNSKLANPDPTIPLVPLHQRRMR